MAPACGRSPHCVLLCQFSTMWHKVKGNSQTHMQTRKWLEICFAFDLFRPCILAKFYFSQQGQESSIRFLSKLTLKVGKPLHNSCVVPHARSSWDETNFTNSISSLTYEMFFFYFLGCALAIMHGWSLNILLINLVSIKCLYLVMVVFHVPVSSHI